MGALPWHRVAQRQKARMSRKRTDEAFIMIRRIMLESPAWRVLSITARRALNAIEREHLRHAGKDNGKLIVTYKTLAEYCLAGDQHLISQALRELEALGFIVVKRGKGGNAGRYEPNEFGLTYLPWHNGAPTDEWSQITTIEEAKQRVEDAKRKRGQTEWFKTATVVGFPHKRNRKAGNQEDQQHVRS
jgi:hypothetical protein